jgi:hypothetical protein
MDERNPRFEKEHDTIYLVLDQVKNWFVYAHLSFRNPSLAEPQRVNKFHLLMKEVAKRYLGKRDYNSLGWYLREEGNGIEKHFHFHFGMTSHNLENRKVEGVCQFMLKQWQKIDGGSAVIQPWDKTKTAKGIWYLTQKDNYPFPLSTYFDPFHRGKMSKTLAQAISSP